MPLFSFLLILVMLSNNMTTHGANITTLETSYIEKFKPSLPAAFGVRFPALANAVAYLPAIAYGGTDLPFVSSSIAAYKTIGGISSTLKVVAFAGPLVNCVMNMIFPQPSTQDVIDQISEHFDDLMQKLVDQMKANMQVLATQLSEETDFTRNTVYDVNRQASFRALSQRIEVLNALQLKVTQSQSDYSWSYEMSPCGPSMTLCNNAFTYIAYQLDEYLAACQLYAQHSKIDPLIYLVNQGDYILTTLTNSIVPLTKVNAMISSRKVSVAPFDLLKQAQITNSYTLQQSYAKAYQTYLCYIYSVERTIYSVTYTRGVAPVDHPHWLIKSALFETIVYQQSTVKMNYTSGLWNNHVVVTKFTDLQKTYSCPPGSFLSNFTIDKVQMALFRFDCVQPGNTRSHYSHVKYFFVSGNQLETTVSCPEVNYFLTSITFNNFSQYRPTEYQCAKPQFIQDASQCDIVSVVHSNLYFLFVNYELWDVTQLLTSNSNIFQDKPDIVLLDSTINFRQIGNLNQASIGTFNHTYILSYRNTFHQVSDKAFTKCQFSADKLVLFSVDDLLNKVRRADILIDANEVSRIITVSLEQDTDKPDILTAYSFYFQNMNTYPAAVTFKVQLSDQVEVLLEQCALFNGSFTWQMQCQYDRYTKVIKVNGMQQQIASQSYLKLTIKNIKNPHSSLDISPFKMEVYMDNSLIDLIEESYQNIYPKITCNWPCLTCATNDKSLCQSCYKDAPKRYLFNNTCIPQCTFYEYYNDIDQGFECLRRCPDNSFLENKTCVKCSSSCLTCNGASDKACTSCNQSDIMAYYYQGTCNTQCPQGTFVGTKYMCEKCADQCKTCTKTRTECTSCSGNQLLYEGNCISQCPLSWFAMNAICKRCHQNCTSCSVTSTSCHTCAQGFVLFNSTCITNCPLGWYNSSGVCKNACPFGQKISTTNECVDICQRDSFYNGLNCTKCHTNCGQCSLSASNCTSCLTGSYLENSICVGTCHFNSYASNGVCIKCAQSCDVGNPYCKQGSCTRCESDQHCQTFGSQLRCQSGTCKSQTSCLHKNTKVYTFDRLSQQFRQHYIKDLQSGDDILSFDQTSNQWIFTRVLYVTTHIQGRQSVVREIVYDVNDQRQSLVMTNDHFIWYFTAANGKASYDVAQILQKGDLLISMNNLTSMIRSPGNNRVSILDIIDYVVDSSDLIDIQTSHNHMIANDLLVSTQTDGDLSVLLPAMSILSYISPYLMQYCSNLWVSWNLGDLKRQIFPY